MNNHGTKFISFIREVLKQDKSEMFNEEHSSNIPNILNALKLLKHDKYKNINNLYLTNKRLISLTFYVTIFTKSISDIEKLL